MFTTGFFLSSSKIYEFKNVLHVVDVVFYLIYIFNIYPVILPHIQAAVNIDSLIWSQLVNIH